MKVGIVGYGHVGSAMKQLFTDAVVYDKYKQIGSPDEINTCQAVFVCVPTPPAQSGACDTSAVDEVMRWLRTDVVILRSTVPVGYTDRIADETGLDVVFQPEYYGETVDHPFATLSSREWITLGGSSAAVDKAIAVYQTVYNAEVRIHIADARTAELAKYMENCFLATKVTFCNEFYDIAKALDVDYHQLRELWLADPRIGRSHTFVYPDARGFGGNCLPKDLGALLAIAEENAVDTTLLSAVQEKNNTYHK